MPQHNKLHPNPLTSNRLRYTSHVHLTISQIGSVVIVGPPYDGLIAYYSGDDDKDDLSANQDKIIKSRDHSDKVVISTNTPLSPNSRFLGLFTVERSFGK